MYLFPPPQEKPIILQSVPPLVRPISDGLWAMEVWRITPPAGGRDPVLVLVRFNVLVRVVWRWRCPLVGIMSPAFYPRLDGVSSIVGGRVEVCLRRISRDLVGGCLWWIRSDPVFVRLCSCVFRLDPSDLKFSSSAAVAVLGRWSYGTLARRLPDCLL